MPNKRGATVQSVERAIAILNAFTVNEPELGVGELSRRLSLAKSTVFRLLSTLEAGGLVSQNPETGRYRLGAALIGLANNVSVYGDLRRVARLHLQHLANTVQETVSLGILDGHETVNVEQFVPPGRLVKEVGWVGRRMPVHSVSVGKAILAFLPEDELTRISKSALEPLTTHTITDPDTLRAELTNVREQGYASGFEELEEGLHALSAPIYNQEGRVVAAVSVSGPSYRLTRQRVQQLVPQVIDTALNISRELGYRAQA